MEPNHQGLIFNIQRYSLHDGPGIRTTVFLKGCPLRCPWCHNPESRSSIAEPRVNEAQCLECGECIEICPERSPGRQGRQPNPSYRPGPPSPASVGHWNLAKNLTVFDASHTDMVLDGPFCCTLCGTCVDNCPAGARQIIGQEITTREVLDEVLRDRLFFDQSGGGVTLSGGEPLAQPEFTLDLLKALRAEDVHTALDTSGYAPWEHYVTLLRGSISFFTTSRPWTTSSINAIRPFRTG